MPWSAPGPAGAHPAPRLCRTVSGTLPQRGPSGPTLCRGSVCCPPGGRCSRAPRLHRDRDRTAAAGSTRPARFQHDAGRKTSILPGSQAQVRYIGHQLRPLRVDLPREHPAGLSPLQGHRRIDRRICRQKNRFAIVAAGDLASPPGRDRSLLHHCHPRPTTPHPKRQSFTDACHPTECRVPRPDASGSLRTYERLHLLATFTGRQPAKCLPGAVTPPPAPWGTFAVKLVGCLVLGGGSRRSRVSSDPHRDPLAPGLPRAVGRHTGNFEPHLCAIKLL
jgi:hypothetical protein